MRTSEKYLLWLLAILLGLFFRETWFSAAAYFARDITYVFHPMHVFTAENLQAGRLPLWNPYAAGGVPWMGDPQTGAFYPGNLPFFLFPFSAAFKLHQAAHFFLTALGAYLLARSRRASPGAAVTAALLWSLNGFWVARLEFPSLLGTITWLPWVTVTSSPFSRLKAKTVFSDAWTVYAAVVLSFSFLSGHTPHFVWTVLLWAVWLAVEGGGRRAIRTLITAGALAAVLTAVQLLGTVEALWQSERFRAGLSLDDALRYSLAPRHLLGLAVPSLSALREHAYTGEKFFWLGSFHLGLAGAGLAALAWAVASRRRRLAWGFVFLFGALLSLGDRSPVYGWLYGFFPFFRAIRYPAQFTFLILAAGLLLIVSAAPALSRRVRGSVWAGLLGLAALELFVYGWNRFPVLAADYFHARPGWIAPLQAPDAGRLFLSPKATSWTRAEGRTLEERWGRLRSRLLNLGTVPYHVRGVNPFGVALIPRGAAAFLDRVYSRPDFGGAAADLGRYNVRWIAAPGPLAAPSLVPREEAPWKLYENLSALPAAVWRADSAAEDDGVFIGWRREEEGPNRCAFRGPPARGGALRVPEFAYPGWTAHAGGRRLSLRAEGPFVSIGPLAGAGEVRFVYRPGPFRVGLVLTLLALGCLAAFYIMEARSYVTNRH